MKTILKALKKSKVYSEEYDRSTLTAEGITYEKGLQLSFDENDYKINVFENTIELVNKESTIYLSIFQKRVLNKAVDDWAERLVNKEK